MNMSILRHFASFGRFNKVNHDINLLKCDELDPGNL